MGDVRVLFTTSQYEAAAAFYRDLLGAEVVTSWDDHGRGVVLRIGGGNACVELIEDSDAAPPRGVVLVVEVDDIDAVHRELAARGVDITQPLADQPWGHRSCAVTDPDGVTVVLYTVTATHA